MLDEAGCVADPLVLVNLDDPGVTLPAADGRLFVGVATKPLTSQARLVIEALDLALSAEGAAADGRQVPRQCVVVPEAEKELAALAEVVARSPQASLVLGQVLRATETLPVLAALDVESFAYSMLLGGKEFGHWLSGNEDREPPPLVDEPVRVRREENVLRVTLNRPERRNAYGRQLRDALTDALLEALLDPSIRHVVLDGAGPCFSSGGDPAELGEAPDLATAHFVRTMAGAGRLLHELAERTEVLVHGPCAGAGVDSPAFAETVTAAEGTTFTLPEVSMGLIPGVGGTVSIPRRVGRWRACYLALSGRSIDARTAQSWGLIDRIATAG